MIHIGCSAKEINTLYLLEFILRIECVCARKWMWRKYDFILIHHQPSCQLRFCVSQYTNYVYSVYMYIRMSESIKQLPIGFYRSEYQNNNRVYFLLAINREFSVEFRNQTINQIGRNIAVATIVIHIRIVCS